MIGQIELSCWFARAVLLCDDEPGPGYRIVLRQELAMDAADGGSTQPGRR